MLPQSTWQSSDCYSDNFNLVFQTPGSRDPQSRHSRSRLPSPPTPPRPQRDPGPQCCPAPPSRPRRCLGRCHWSQFDLFQQSGMSNRTLRGGDRLTREVTNSVPDKKNNTVKDDTKQIQSPIFYGKTPHIHKLHIAINGIDYLTIQPEQWSTLCHKRWWSDLMIKWSDLRGFNQFIKKNYKCGWGSQCWLQWE